MWNALRLHWLLWPVIFNQSDCCVRQRTRGIQKSIARVQAHFSSPHSSRRLSFAAPPSLPAITPQTSEPARRLRVWVTEDLNYQEFKLPRVRVFEGSSHRGFQLPRVWVTEGSTFWCSRVWVTGGLHWVIKGLSHRGFEMLRVCVTEGLSYRGFELPRIWITEALSYRGFARTFSRFELLRIMVVEGSRYRGFELLIFWVNESSSLFLTRNNSYDKLLEEINRRINDMLSLVYLALNDAASSYISELQFYWAFIQYQFRGKTQTSYSYC